MSSQNKYEHISTNESTDEIIDKTESLNLDSTTAETNTHDFTENNFNINDTNKNSEKSEEENIDLCDFVDEEELKQINADLSEEQKTSRRKQASELKKEANLAYKNEDYLKSIELYTDALRLYPLEDKIERSILYSNRAASKINLKYKKTALDDCTKSLELNPHYIRAYIRRARVYQDMDKLDECLEDYKKVIELDPGNKEAIASTMKLPAMINERNEKLKTEMLGKLKDLGNMFLKPFGLSTNNFNLQQDPNTGSYSVSFQQNP